jgi:hypothetical protein
MILICLHLLNVNIRSFSSEIFLLHCILKFHTIYYIFRLCITLSIFIYKMILIINLWFHLHIISIEKRKKLKIINRKRKKQEEENLLTKVKLSHILYRQLIRQQYRTVHQKAIVDTAITRWRQCDSAMATVRWRQNDNATVRWRQCDSAIATVR